MINNNILFKFVTCYIIRINIYLIIFSILNIFCYNIVCAQDLSLSGKIKVYKDNDIGMMIAKLIKEDGEEIILGAPGNMSSETRNCINNANGTDDIVNIYAKYAYDGIDDRTIVCEKNNIAGKHNNTNLIGPEIFGLQLGMFKKNVASIIVDFANKHKYIIKEGFINNDLNFDICKNENDIFPIVTLVFKKDILNSIIVYNNQIEKDSIYYSSLSKNLISKYKFKKDGYGTYYYLTPDLKISMNNLAITVHK